MGRDRVFVLDRTANTLAEWRAGVERRSGCGFRVVGSANECSVPGWANTVPDQERSVVKLFELAGRATAESTVRSIATASTGGAPGPALAVSEAEV
eukprot:7224701-Prymnesium_polylepis.1